MCEAVYQKVGLSRTESASLVELVLKEITDCLERGETVKLSSFGSFVVRKKGQRIGRNPKTGKEVPISPRRVMVFKPSAILKQRINGGEVDGHWRTTIDVGTLTVSVLTARSLRERRLGQGAGRIPHHQRGRRRSQSAAARAAVLGEPLPQIKPMKRAGGRRYYRPDDVDLLRGIHHLLYGEGYTIRGVQRILKDQGIKFVEPVWQAGAEQPPHGPQHDGDDAHDAHDERAPRGRLFDRLQSLTGRNTQCAPARARISIRVTPEADAGDGHGRIVAR